MELVKSTVRLDLQEGLSPWLQLRGLLRAAGGDVAAEVQAAPLVVDRAVDKLRVTLTVRAVTIEDERSTTADEASGRTLDLLTGLHAASALPKITSLRLDSFYIEPYAKPFHELVKDLQHLFVRDTALSQASTDFAVTFDRREDKSLRHVQVGPMDLTQLRSQFLRWPPREMLPETFVFMNLAYQQEESTEFSEELIQSVMTIAAQWQTIEAQSLIAEFKRE